MNSALKALRLAHYRKLASIFLAGAIALMLFLPSSANANSNGNQIGFGVTGGVTYLKIKGMNQYGADMTWERRFDYPQWIVKTDGYWWKGTIVITFYGANVGWGGCVIDYLSEPQYDDTVYVTYQAGYGCTGSMGSAGVLIPEATAQELAKPDLVLGPASCFVSLAQGNTVFIARDCVVGMTAELIKGIAQFNGKSVEMR